MIAIWLLAIYTDGTTAFVYGLRVKEVYPDFVAARVRVGTFVDAPVTFFVILYLTRRWGWKVALPSGVIGTASAPMIFELPFDLIVMARTNPPIPAAFLPAGGDCVRTRSFLNTRNSRRGAPGRHGARVPACRGRRR
jgi:hypothetical protein